MNLKDKSDLDSLLNIAPWKEAKSYSKTAPHCYSLKDKWQNPIHFERFVEIIKANPTPVKFYSKTYNYLVYGEYQYWTMEPAGVVPILINRALVKNKYV